MTDLHTHILPFMDDGANDINEAIALLTSQKQQGIKNVALTSHFNCEEMEIDTFLRLRENSYRKLLSFFTPELHNMRLKLGCEVRYSPNLQSVDYQLLCLDETNLLLLELPSNQYPPFLDRVLYDLRSNGVIPLIAHVERYSYVLKNPAVLYDWASGGAYIQVNANSLLKNGRKNWVLKMIGWGLVHVICSDTHSIAFRPPNISEAMSVVCSEMGESKMFNLKQNAKDLFEGREPINIESHKPRKLCGMWF